MSMKFRDISDYKISEMITPHKKLVAKFYICVMDCDDGKLRSGMRALTELANF